MAPRREQDEYTAGLVGKLIAIAIELNGVAGRLNALAADLRVVYPAVPGE